MDDILERIVAFVKERDWEQFQNPKDTAISLSLEAAELLEHFQWKNESEIKSYLQSHKDEVADELFDVLYWVLLMSYYLKIDLKQAASRKMAQNEAKYPVSKAKGNHKKYTDHQT